MTWVGAGRVIRQLGNILVPLRGGHGVACGGADPLDSVIDVEIPYLYRAVGCIGGEASGDDGPPVRAECHRVDSACGAGQGLAEPGWSGWVGQVPQLDSAASDTVG